MFLKAHCIWYEISSDTRKFKKKKKIYERKRIQNQFLTAQNTEKTLDNCTTGKVFHTKPLSTILMASEGTGPKDETTKNMCNLLEKAKTLKWGRQVEQRGVVMSASGL